MWTFKHYHTRSRASCACFPHTSQAQTFPHTTRISTKHCISLISRKLSFLLPFPDSTCPLTSEGSFLLPFSSLIIQKSCPFSLLYHHLSNSTTSPSSS
ncbi:hypothetical protein PAXRUDRAFT_469954 [Paxillus rubicundulus Ve08.2h10]|uniref:Uncharacterized protein n=1 Tax=Paxillus rubicundulus Ve08.2h10 TaxID=930991 RepID=A0A0D0DE88_9AGAM|nr:hypothetical protein PAXRUDRAFT_469954 [Paxillus rubicundulus Ve08.2h10]